MKDYVYQIQGALESAQGELKGLRILVCDLNNFDSVDVPISVLDKETAQYLAFRIGLTDRALNIQRLPVKVQNSIRVPLGNWLDKWVRENFNGNNSKSKDTNP